MSNPRHQPNPHTLLELWEVLLRYRWRLIIPAFLVAAMVLMIGLVLPRKYRAVGMFERRNDLVLTEMASRGATGSFQDPRQSLTEALTGLPALNELLDQAWPEIQREGLLPAHVRREDFREDLRRRITVRFDISTPELDRVRVEYVAPGPAVGRLVVNGLIENYIARTRALLDARLRESASFFRDEVTRHRRTIETLENGILEFEITNGDLLPESPNNIQGQLLTLEQDVGNLTRLRETTALRIQSLRQALAETPTLIPTVVTGKNPQFQRIEAKRRELEARLAECLTTLKMTERHPDVLSLQQAIESLDLEAASLEQEVVTSRDLATNPKRAELELALTSALTEHKAFDDQIAALRMQIEKLSAQTGNLFEVRSTHRKLNRDLDESRRQLDFWEENLRRVEMALAAESGNRGVQLDFIAPAELPSRPTSPNLGQAVAAAIFLGLGAGALTLFHAHRSDDTFDDGDELSRQVDLPLFGGVSEILTRRDRGLRHLRHLIVYPACGMAIACVLLGLIALLYRELEDPDVFARISERAVAAASHATPGPQAAVAAELPANDQH